MTKTGDETMSQRSEKYAREIGRTQRMHSVKLDSLGDRVQQLESRESVIRAGGTAGTGLPEERGQP